MRTYFQWAIWMTAATLLALVITRMLAGWYRRFPLVFAYCVASLLGIIAQVAARNERQFAIHLYWYSEQIEQTLVYCIVIVLIYQALNPERRAQVGRWLIASAALVAVASAMVHWGQRAVSYSLWMTSWSRDLNFAAAILDLLLWTVLIASRRKDRILLMISGGLGIKFTGAAIGYSLSLIPGASNRMAIFIGGIIKVITYLVCLYVWWEAFRRARSDVQLEPAGR
jgi:hypothetical protein